MKHLDDWTMGIDLGDLRSVVFGICRLTGEVIESEFAMKEAALRERFPGFECFEAGAQSR